MGRRYETRAGGPMLCGELVNGGLASVGAVTVPCGLLGLGLPGYLRAGPQGAPSPYLALLAELIAEQAHLLNAYMELDDNRELEMQLAQDDIDEDVLLGKSFDILHVACIIRIQNKRIL